MTPRSIALIVVLAGCSDSTGPNYAPPTPTSLSSAVTNPLFPLVPGKIFVFHSETAAGLEVDTVEVLVATKTVNGFAATEVHDRVYVAGALSEDTYDWYAQDSAGNVWYLGEDTKEYQNGQVVSTEGSWEWGVDGALPGLIAWADPAAYIGKQYRQEFEQDVAEDWGKVVAVNQPVTVTAGAYTGCVVTEEWNDLEPGPHEHKYYCPQLGIVLEVAGNGERSELVSVSGP